MVLVDCNPSHPSCRAIINSPVFSLRRIPLLRGEKSPTQVLICVVEAGMHAHDVACTEGPTEGHLLASGHKLQKGEATDIIAVNRAVAPR